MKMFFVTSADMPNGYGFSTFGIEHILWLAALSLVIVAAAVAYKRLNDKHRKIMLKVVGVLVVFAEIIKDVILIIKGEFGYGYLPFHLCGINVLLIGFDLIKQTKIVRSFLYYFCIPGAMLALIFPNWTHMPCMNFFNIHSFTIHLLLEMYPVLLVTSGEARPDVRDMPKCIGLLVALAIPIYFLNMVWGTNFMFLMKPDSGNPLEMFKMLLGSHLWGFPILLPIVMLIMYIPLCIIYRNKKQTEQISEIEEKETVTL